MKPKDLIQLASNVYLFPNYPPFHVSVCYKDRSEELCFKDKRELKRWINILTLVEDYVDVIQRDRKNQRRRDLCASSKDVLPQMSRKYGGD